MLEISIQVVLLSTQLTLNNIKYAFISNIRRSDSKSRLLMP